MITSKMNNTKISTKLVLKPVLHPHVGVTGVCPHGQPHD